MIFMDSNGIVINEMYFIVPRGTQSMAQQITIQNPFSIDKTITLYGIESPTNQLGRASDTYQAQFFSTDGVNYSQSLQVTIPGSSSVLIYTKFSPPDMAVPGDCEWTFHHEPNEDCNNAPLGLTKEATIQLIGSIDDAKTNYQIQVTIPYQSFMRPDFGDIRFIDTDGSTILNYNRVSYTTSDTATFDVLIPSLPASPSTYILTVYSGNSSVTDASNPSAVYEYLYQQGDLATKWSVVRGTWTESNGVITCTTPGTDIGIAYVTNSNQENCIIECDLQFGSSQRAGIIFGRTSSSFDWIVDYDVNPDDPNYYIQTSSDSNTHSEVTKASAKSTVGVDLNYHHWKLVIGSSITLYIDGTPVVTYAGSPAAAGQYGLTHWYQTFVNVKNFKVSKYALNPPTIGTLSTWQDTIIKDHDVEVKAEIQYAKAEIEGLEYNTSFGVRIGGNYYE